MRITLVFYENSVKLHRFLIVQNLRQIFALTITIAYPDHSAKHEDRTKLVAAHSIGVCSRRLCGGQVFSAHCPHEYTEALLRWRVHGQLYSECLVPIKTVYALCKRFRVQTRFAVYPKVFLQSQ